MISKITPVILTGGSGTRLWPMSRKATPKQFLALTGEKAMLAETMARAAGEGFAPPLLVGGAAQEEALRRLAPHAQLILEPAARNTAPAIALAAFRLDPETPMLVMPSDHVIADTAAFRTAIDMAAGLARQGWLVTFGIAPAGPETGYGYIRQGAPLGGTGYMVESFVEKPDAETARTYIDQGSYHWNGGIFLFTAGRYLEAVEAHAPEMAAAARRAVEAGTEDGAAFRPDVDAFAACPSDSIDYAVMEKAERVAVVPVDMGWSDVGSWDALYEIADKDGDGNALAGGALAIDAENCLIRGEGVTVAAVGVVDLVIVAMKDAVLVLPRGESQRVKEAVEKLKVEDNDLL